LFISGDAGLFPAAGRTLISGLIPEIRKQTNPTPFEVNPLQDLKSPLLKFEITPIKF
jgi:hypothetical protein